MHKIKRKRKLWLKNDVDDERRLWEQKEENTDEKQNILYLN